MKCPYCNHEESKVVDSRDTENGIRRRRECLKCEARFTTYERPQGVALFVIKKDQRREEFNKDKLLAGLRKACEKRPLAAGAIERIADDIETELYTLGRPEVPSSVIGDMVMLQLRRLDSVAYIRFASVYRDFTDITDLKQEVESLMDHQPPPRSQLTLPIKS
jgi:transcriptional repressor NrdR